MRVPSRFVLAFLLAAGAAHAQPVAVWSSTRAAVPVVVAPGTVALQQGSELSRLLAGRSYIPHGSVATNGTTLLRDLLEAPPGPRGPIPGTYVQRPITWGATMKAVARGLPAVGTAFAIAELLDAIRCRTNANASAWECDEGQPEVLEGDWLYWGPNWSASAGQPTPDPVGWHNSQPAVTYDGWQALTWGPAQQTGLTGPSSCQTPAYVGANQCRTMETSRQATCVYIAGPSSGQACAPRTDTRVHSGALIQSIQCPAINGVRPPVGADGLCPTGTWSPADVVDVEVKGTAHGNRARAPDIVRELDLQGKPIEHDFPSVQDLPATINGDRSIITRPDGDREVTDSRYEIEPTAEGYRWREVIETRIYPPTGDIPPPWTDTNPPDSSTNTPPEFKGCGLPDTPPCKIDETGTPSGAQGEGIAAGPRAQIEALRGQQIDLIETERQADLPWLFDLGLPTGACTPIVLNLNGRTVEVDLCTNWLVLFFRELWAWALVVITGLYCWRSVTLTTGAR